MECLGFTTYDAVKYFEDITISKKEDSIQIPDMYYAVYQNILAINHFKNEAYIFAHCYESKNNIETIGHLIKMQSFSSYDFKSNGKISSNLTDEAFKANVDLANKNIVIAATYFNLYYLKNFNKILKEMISMYTVP